MARLTYRDRLQAIIDNPACGSRDRTFAESLLGYYNRSGKLTQGRARCVKQLEERYSPENLAVNAAKGQESLKRLNAVCERTEAKSWDRGFVNSLQSQVMTGRELSARQLEILGQIEERNNDAAISERESWGMHYDEVGALGASRRDCATIAARYYQQAGYFQSLVTNILTDPSFVPSQREYNKLTGNKYAQKVIAATLDAPKYAAGSLVMVRPNAGSVARRAAAKRPCVVISTTETVVSAAKGAKMYKILPMGAVQTMFIEERHIKKARV
jgi:hypothetical protein